MGGVTSAITELVDHSGGRLIGPRAVANGRRFPTNSTAAAVLGTVSPERRLASAWFGTGYRTKVRAWDEAVTMAKALERVE